MVNEHGIYVRMYMIGGKVYTLAIMTDNDILRLKYIGNPINGIALSSISIGNSVRIIIEDVFKNMGTTWNDAKIRKEYTTITIGSGSDSLSYGTWTSTIKPNNVTVELDCIVINNSKSVVTVKCGSKTIWSESVFNRTPIWISGGALFGRDGTSNIVLFDTDKFPVKGSVPEKWEENTRYNVTVHGSNITIGNQLTIMGLPESFVSHWVNVCPQAYMGNNRVILVPPDYS